jgi:hypothetical protein
VFANVENLGEDADPASLSKVCLVLLRYGQSYGFRCDHDPGASLQSISTRIGVTLGRIAKALGLLGHQRFRYRLYFAWGGQLSFKAAARQSTARGGSDEATKLPYAYAEPSRRSPAALQE